MNYNGIIIGLLTFLMIGVLHPVVIKAEYYFTTSIWPLFLISGFIFIGLSPALPGQIISVLSAVLGFSLLWSIQELFEQKKRVEKGWFPENPKRNKE
ncbi:DUF4491 family protein [Clostridium sp. E02]|uniref:DUF4491 family protein n=1 Tax=Clostridium sp. E02 TaxID=2487134 RepID=UPI000F54A6F4|nr:DUF4491 family protein [Clostridium sp. E02]